MREQIITRTQQPGATQRATYFVRSLKHRLILIYNARLHQQQRLEVKVHGCS